MLSHQTSRTARHRETLPSAREGGSLSLAHPLHLAPSAWRHRRGDTAPRVWTLPPSKRCAYCSDCAAQHTSRAAVSIAAVQCSATGHGWARVARTAAHLEGVVVLAAIVHVVVDLAHALEELARLKGANRAGRRGVAGRRRGLRDWRGRLPTAAAEERVADHGARHGSRHRRAKGAHQACANGRSGVTKRGSCAREATRVGGGGAHRGPPQPGRLAPQAEPWGELPQRSRGCVSQSAPGGRAKGRVRMSRRCSRV